MTDTTVEAPPEEVKKSKLPLLVGVVLALAGGGGGFYATQSGLLPIGGGGHEKDEAAEAAHDEGAPMPNFMRITPGGVGMHAGYLPGFPASHGCIRMPEFMSQHFFENVKVGTPVIVTH